MAHKNCLGFKICLVKIFKEKVSEAKTPHGKVRFQQSAGPSFRTSLSRATWEKGSSKHSHLSDAHFRVNPWLQHPVYCNVFGTSCDPPRFLKWPIVRISVRFLYSPQSTLCMHKAVPHWSTQNQHISTLYTMPTASNRIFIYFDFFYVTIWHGMQDLIAFPYTTYLLHTFSGFESVAPITPHRKFISSDTAWELGRSDRELKDLLVFQRQSTRQHGLLSLTSQENKSQISRRLPGLNRWSQRCRRPSRRIQHRWKTHTKPEYDRALLSLKGTLWPLVLLQLRPSQMQKPKPAFHWAQPLWLRLSRSRWSRPTRLRHSRPSKRHSRLSLLNILNINRWAPHPRSPHLSHKVRISTGSRWRQPIRAKEKWKPNPSMPGSYHAGVRSFVAAFKDSEMLYSWRSWQ